MGNDYSNGDDGGSREDAWKNAHETRDFYT
jgi:hypothetical protein